MKRLFALAIAGLFLLSCTSTQGGGGQSATLPEGKLQLVREACFEVVAEKPKEEAVVYGKPLNWDLVDFAIRNDRYIPLGTAFAISSTELVTAAHVLDIAPGSQVYRTRFIRQRTGKGSDAVFEIADIRAYSLARDYVVFTVKGRKFDKWLKTTNVYSLNSRIYTAGDAYGEGIVIREGLLLDETPEPENGEWHFLKSSIATNPGNSGGPLLNTNAEVIGIALSHKDDLCYSLPMKEIVPGKAFMHRRHTVGFAVFGKQKIMIQDAAWDLPLPYRELAARCDAAYIEFYNGAMDSLLSENRQDLFPEGPNSEKALYRYVDSVLPQMYLQDSANQSWFLTDLGYDTTNIEDSGYIRYAEAYKDAGIWLLYLKRPDTVSVQSLWEDPKKTMDLLLTGINITRKLTQSDEGSRVLSFGKPVQSIAFTDRFGRPWQLNVFYVEYSDQFLMTCATPTPQGLSMLYLVRTSAQKDAWLYDMKKLPDFMNISYYGTLEEWDAFQHQAAFRVGSLKSVSVSYKEGAYVEIDTEDLAAHIPQGPIGINKGSRFAVVYGVFRKEGKPTWDIRKVLVDTDRANADNYCTFFRWVEPASTLPGDLKDDWKKYVLDRGHPYDGEPYTEDGNTFVGMLHPDYIKNGFAYTVGVGKEGSVAEDAMKNYLQELARGTRIKN